MTKADTAQFVTGPVRHQIQPDWQNRLTGRDIVPGDPQAQPPPSYHITIDPFDIFTSADTVPQQSSDDIWRAILAGDTESGVCIMQMEAGLDTGPVLMRGTVPITDTTTASTLHDALAVQGAELIVKTLEKIETLKPQKQPEEGMTYAAMLTKEDGKIGWTQPATMIERQLRALHPWPGVWCEHNGQRLKVLEVSIEKASGKPGEILDRHLIIACGTDALLLKKIQPQDRKPMDGVSFMNGTHLNVGDMLS